MRVERHHDRGRAAFAGDADEAVEDLAVTAVHAVEIPEREDRLLPARRPHIVGKVNDIHQCASPLRPW